MAPGIGINFKTAGVPELFAALREADKKIARKAIRRGIKAAIKPIVKDAKSEVPEETGTLKKSLGDKIASYKSGSVVVGIGGPRYDKKPKPGKPQKKKRFARKVMVGGKEKERVPTFYAHLVEKGTRPHALGKGSRIARMDKRKVAVNQHGRLHPGGKPHPFLKPALAKNKSQVKATITMFLKAAIEALNKKG